ncbi:hypothetical protein [Dolichospermum heterosporum]|uniref:Type 4 fimbrial biogenesis protein PilX N-terminal domain-containing protein n=1 Tax=Dolichospermum heterosporum TAC447 TaxID=747523 RepID=A0ABY5LME0_9CYAN|nr:hypothetical protein [Dolichospermum heterosporum]UUO13117.1 hypothetical protein NG743_13440 [Dolichospermum heterosporum TAC447]
MNPRLKLALIRHTGEQGFASVIAVGVGLVMILIGLTMALRSQGDVALGLNQKNTSRALSIAEVSITRYQYLINTNRNLAKVDFTSTNLSSSYTSALSSSSQCSNIAITTEKIVNTYAGTSDKDYWLPVTSDDPKQGEYKLVSYTYKQDDPNAASGTLPGTGTLTVQGRVNNNSTSTSTAQIQVKIPVKAPDPGNGEALWTISGSIVGSNNQKIDGDIKFKCGELTPAQITTMKENNLANNNVNQVIESSSPMRAAPALPNTYTDLGDITKDTTLSGSVSADGNATPTPTPTPTSSYQGRPVYKVGDIGGNGKITLTIPPTQKVVIFLTGSIDKNVTINHNCSDYTEAQCSPSDVLIIGTGTKYPSGNPSICLNGSNTISAFIYAPTYDVAVSGGGNADPVIYGNVWAKSWNALNGCGSSSNKVVVKTSATVTAQGKNLLKDVVTLTELPPTIDLPSSWTKQKVN